jgi:AcrR family transcriptional regulator
MSIRNDKSVQIDSLEEIPEVKSKIIKASQELFVKKGYHRTSIPDIIKLAQVSIGALYHYFPSKEILAKKIHEHSVMVLIQNFDEKILTLPTARERVSAFIKLMFEWTENDPVFVEYLLYARPQDIFNKRISICSQEGLSLVMDIIKYGQQNNEIKLGNCYPYYTILNVLKSWSYINTTLSCIVLKV